jgi:hypothetical protein
MSDAGGDNPSFPAYTHAPATEIERDRGSRLRRLMCGGGYAPPATGPNPLRGYAP